MVSARSRGTAVADDPGEMDKCALTCVLCLASASAVASPPADKPKLTPEQRLNRTLESYGVERTDPAPRPAPAPRLPVPPTAGVPTIMTAPFVPMPGMAPMPPAPAATPSVRGWASRMFLNTRRTY